VTHRYHFFQSFFMAQCATPSWESNHPFPPGPAEISSLPRRPPPKPHRHHKRREAEFADGDEQSSRSSVLKFVVFEFHGFIFVTALKPKQVKYFGADLTGIALRADDLDWSYGTGTPITGAAQDLLLVLCNRRLPAGRLRGEPSARFTTV